MHGVRDFASMNLQAVLISLLLSLVVVGIAQADEETRKSAPAKPAAGQIDRLIADLDDDLYSIRQRAHIRLLKLADQALPALTKATRSKSTEQRYRALELIRVIQHRVLHEGFVKLASQPDNEIDLEQGMWLISRILNPQANRGNVDKQLDELAAAVRRRLGEGVDPKRAAPAKAVNAIIHVLKNECQFEGNTTDYHNPNNSSLEKVLETKKGLPILLSHVAVAVADRLEVPLVGIGVPTRYMVKYDGSRAPKEHPSEDIIIHPFDGWRILTSEQVRDEIPSFDPATHLTPSPRRESLSRMMRNLVSHLQTQEQLAKAEQVQRFIFLLESYNTAEP